MKNRLTSTDHNKLGLVTSAFLGLCLAVNLDDYCAAMKSASLSYHGNKKNQPLSSFL